MKKSKLFITIVAIIVSIIACTKDNTTEPVVKNPPAAPRNLTATNKLYGNKVVINWQKTTNTTDYKLYRSVNDTLSFNLLATVTDTVYTDTAVTSANLYYYKVQAQNTDGGSSYSNQSVGQVYKTGYRIKKELINQWFEGAMHTVYRNTYFYTDSGLLSHIIDSCRMTQNSPYELDRKTTFSYNPLKQLIRQVVMNHAENNNFTNSRKIQYEYAQTLINTENHYNWSSGEWHLTTSKEYVYSSSNPLLVIGSGSYRTCFYYTGDRIDSTIIYSGNTTPSSKYDYIYSNNLLIRKDYFNYSYEGWSYWGNRSYEYEAFADTFKTDSKLQNNQLIFNHESITRFKR